MRGDSLRDLYAKTLAVLGLGVLAGVGALVDYWPAGIRYPAVASTFSPSALFPAPVTVLPARTRLPALAGPALPAEPVAETSRVPVLATFSVYEPALPLGEPLELRPQEAPVPVSMPVAVVARLDDSARAALVAEADQPAAEATVPDMVPGAVDSTPGASADAGGRGFVSGALNKTTSSLVRTGRWTGASIVSAARVVRGVVGRAIPN